MCKCGHPWASHRAAKKCSADGCSCRRYKQALCGAEGPWSDAAKRANLPYKCKREPGHDGPHMTVIITR